LARGAAFAARLAMNFLRDLRFGFQILARNQVCTCSAVSVMANVSPTNYCSRFARGKDVP
jgi:hypothetical protein